MAIYSIYKNGSLIYSGSQFNEPTLRLAVNEAGSLEFTGNSPITSVSASEYKLDTYEVRENNNIIFQGRPAEIQRLYNNRAHYYIDGAYSYFNDTTAGYMEMPFVAPASDIFLEIIGSHNEQSQNNRKIYSGTVDIENVVVRQFKHEKCIDELRSLRDECGGFMYMTYPNGQATLNWTQELPTIATQPIELGVNILDFNQNINPADVITSIIPLGPVIEKTNDASKVDDLHILETDTSHLYLVGQNLTLTNRTKVYNTNYIDNAYVSEIGRHFLKVDFSSVKSANELLTAAQRYMTNIVTDMIHYTTDVVDIHYAAGYDHYEPILFPCQLHVVADLYDVDTYLPCCEMNLNLYSAVKEITIGNPKRQALSEKLLKDTSKQSSTDKTLQKQIDDLKNKEAEGGGGGGGDSQFARFQIPRTLVRTKSGAEWIRTPMRNEFDMSSDPLSWSYRYASFGGRDMVVYPGEFIAKIPEKNESVPVCLHLFGEFETDVTTVKYYGEDVEQSTSKQRLSSLLVQTGTLQRQGNKFVVTDFTSAEGEMLYVAGYPVIALGIRGEHKGTTYTNTIEVTKL